MPIDMEIVRQGRAEGKGVVKIAKENGINPKTLDTAVRRARRRGEDVGQPINTAQTTAGVAPKDALLKVLRTNKSIDAAQYAKAYNLSPRMLEAVIADLQDEGYLIEPADGGWAMTKMARPEPRTIDGKWSGDKYIRFGLLGDTQINSKYTQLTHLHTAYDTYKAEGITEVYHTGDIDEGEQMRPGHQYECYNQGIDDHVKEIVRVYPRIDGTKTRFITGNHDHSMIRLAGCDIGDAIAAKRPDMEYIGQSQAFIQLTPNCLFEMRHPGDGTAYAKSYKIQKMIEAMSGGEKPNLLAVGHYHKMMIDFYRNVHSIQTACLQAQTNWMRGRGIAAELGYFIVELIVDEGGQIVRNRTEFFPFYRSIKDDWQNFKA